MFCRCAGRQRILREDCLKARPLFRREIELKSVQRLMDRHHLAVRSVLSPHPAYGYCIPGGVVEAGTGLGVEIGLGNGKQLRRQAELPDALDGIGGTKRGR